MKSYLVQQLRFSDDGIDFPDEEFIWWKDFIKNGYYIVFKQDYILLTPNTNFAFNTLDFRWAEIYCPNNSMIRIHFPKAQQKQEFEYVVAYHLLTHTGLEENLASANKDEINQLLKNIFHSE